MSMASCAIGASDNWPASRNSALIRSMQWYDLAMMFRSIAIAICSLLISAGALAQSFSSAERWPEAQREAQILFEHALNAVPTPASLRAYHDLLGSEPHVAGTPGDARTIQRMVDAFKAVGVDDVH